MANAGPHVLHANSLHFQTTVAATWAARRNGVPLVTTVHLAGIDLLPAHVRAATGLWERTVGRWVLATSAEGGGRVRAVDQHVRTRIGDRRVHVVPNGVDLGVFVPGAELDPPVIAFVGRLIANKGPAVLVAAARTLAEADRSFRLLLVGDGPQREELEDAVAASPALAERTTFTGFSSAVHEHLAGAAILVRPSLTEGMPLAVLEAMAADVCPVVSDIPANRLVVDHDRTGLLFPVGDADALAAVLATLLDDPERRRTLARTGHEVAQSFSWDATAAGTAAVLVDAAGWMPGAA
ncbi:MAG: glycosyltransferase [Actinobacteria bacterium]|nr:glycosyltransferase [Actinomycetota bacterium]